MTSIYVYLLDTLADWEIGYVMAELNLKRFFKEGAQVFSFKIVSVTKEPIKTTGGLTIIPDCLIEEMSIQEENILILPGANSWNAPQHDKIIEKAKKLLDAGGTVATICGATTALASAGVLDARPHTSNGVGFLDMMSSDYQGSDFYVDQPAVMDDNLITASSTGGLLLACCWLDK